MASKLYFYIFTPYKIEAIHNRLQIFVADDLGHAWQSVKSKIATSEEMAIYFRNEYPDYYEYKIEAEEISKCLKTANLS